MKLKLTLQLAIALVTLLILLTPSNALGIVDALLCVALFFHCMYEQVEHERQVRRLKKTMKALDKTTRRWKAEAEETARRISALTSLSAQCAAGAMSAVSVNHSIRDKPSEGETA